MLAHFAFLLMLLPLALGQGRRQPSASADSADMKRSKTQYFDDDDDAPQQVAAEYAPDAMEDYKKDFEGFDDNKDGRIDPQEVRAQFGPVLNEEELAKFFLDVDKNGDALINFDEYVNYVVGY